jgi:hypothetical protein
VIILKFIRSNIVAITCSIIILVLAINIDKISDKISESLEKSTKVVITSSNKYKKDDDFLYVQNTTDFVPYGYNDLLNIFYTITNNGYATFTFYCPSEYKNCLDDVEEISDDSEILTYINNFVHPYNSFSNIQTIISESGEINVNITYLYTEEEIKEIEKVVDKIYNENITNDMTSYEKIKVIHDYIINNTKYDVERNETGSSKYASYKAYGTLIEGYATCSGYTDAMAIFLERMNIKNYKIATELMQTDASGHVWNAVYLEGSWLHLDLTWDDPVSDDGKDYIQHKYFLISSNELTSVDQGEVVVKEHVFNNRIYPEMTISKE